MAGPLQGCGKAVESDRAARAHPSYAHAESLNPSAARPGASLQIEATRDEDEIIDGGG